MVERIMSSGEDLIRLMDGLVNKGQVPYLSSSLKVMVESSAIPEGWCTWPFNFDPIWIKECSGYMEGIV